MVEPSEVMAQAESADPEMGLRAVASLRALLEAVEELQVRRARELGWSWQQIALPLGISKQAVHQRFDRDERRPRRSSDEAARSPPCRQTAGEGARG